MHARTNRWTMEDGQWATTKAHHEEIVLRWAKKNNQIPYNVSKITHEGQTVGVAGSCAYLAGQDLGCTCGWEHTVGTVGSCWFPGTWPHVQLLDGGWHKRGWHPATTTLCTINVCCQLFSFRRRRYVFVSYGFLCHNHGRGIQIALVGISISSPNFPSPFKSKSAGAVIKGTQLRSGGVTHLNNIFFRKPVFSCYQRI